MPVLSPASQTTPTSTPSSPSFSPSSSGDTTILSSKNNDSTDINADTGTGTDVDTNSISGNLTPRKEDKEVRRQYRAINLDEENELRKLEEGLFSPRNPFSKQEDEEEEDEEEGAEGSSRPDVPPSPPHLIRGRLRKHYSGRFDLSNTSINTNINNRSGGHSSNLLKLPSTSAGTCLPGGEQQQQHIVTVSHTTTTTATGVPPGPGHVGVDVVRVFSEVPSTRDTASRVVSVISSHEDTNTNTKNDDIENDDIENSDVANIDV